jgi:hypothetical protein
MGVFGRGQVFIEQAAAVCVGGIQNRLAAKGSHHPASCTWHTHSIDFCFIIFTLCHNCALKYMSLMKS